MKTFLPILSLYFFITSHAHSQNVQERLSGFRTVAGLIEPWDQPGGFFESDSGRIYYSGNRSTFENPYTSYLITPFDTLSVLFGASYYEYREWMESNPIYAFNSWFQSYYPHTSFALAYDSMLVYKETDSGFVVHYISEQNCDGNLPESYTLTYEGTNYPWDNYSYEYNANEQLIHMTLFYQTEDNLTEIDRTETYTYKDGLLMSESRTNYYDNQGPDIYEYTYDEDGRFLTMVYMDDSIPEWKQEFLYTGGMLNAIYYYDWDGSGWEETNNKLITYNLDRRMSTVTDDPTDAYDNIQIKYHYNDWGQYDSITKYNIDVFPPVLESIEIFEYDNAGRQTFYSYDDDIYNKGWNEFYVDHDYNEKGQISDINYYVYDYYYDDVYYYYAKRYSYTYTVAGSIRSRANEQLKDIDDEDEVYDEYDDLQVTEPWYTTYFYYDPSVEEPAGDITETIYIHAYPSPVTDMLALLIGGITGSIAITTEIYAITGQLVYHDEEIADHDYTKTINCITYAPGIYMVSVSDGINISRQKIVVR